MGLIKKAFKLAGNAIGGVIGVPVSAVHYGILRAKGRNHDWAMDDCLETLESVAKGGGELGEVFAPLGEWWIEREVKKAANHFTEHQQTEASRKHFEASRKEIDLQTTFLRAVHGTRSGDSTKNQNS